PPRGANTPATRRSLIMQNLRCVLVATVRGARGSCVLLLIGLTTPSCADVTGRQHHFHPPGWASAPMKALDDSACSSVQAIGLVANCRRTSSGVPPSPIGSAW